MSNFYICLLTLFVHLFIHSFICSFGCLFTRLSVCPPILPLVKSFSQNCLINFFWFFAWSQGTRDAKKWLRPIFVDNSFLPKFGLKGPKKVRHFAFFWKFCCHLFFLKITQNESSFNSWLSIANPMSGKILQVSPVNPDIFWYRLRSVGAQKNPPK